jgi:hypothetical protein
MSHAKYEALINGYMCKGTRPEFLEKTHHAHLNNLRPDEMVEACFTAAGIDPKLPRPVSDSDTSDDYAKALRESGDWEEIIPGEDFYPLLKDFDLLTWALSSDGAEGCNGLPGLNGGNTVIGFLIEASGDYPTVWIPADTNLKAGVFPLAECLEFEKTQGSSYKAKLIYIHRRIE